ncbi:MULTISPECIES: carbohydrate ABC transporter permease [unclassified Rathayibacter]|uniref:carbohydrate ABC transporter permease n=2 Tax=unclassified Rathayibacter TaxID=2609250 RepID=UPI000FC26FEC|nr:raffinose/stachyose/melibiose transport system permease protein [Rathayibacter sp. PhB186]ROQ52608.1 raffinose/stachyose/melibiose transport system permease protein [Rathayibacter sp. PhB152]ROS46975.1 raffinose/stachyose/melibiose transport system permease protein [Rathayibacter sp. PhB185]TCL83116.1 raffinose/stachyose/melibiose transport system permease protein [Rathayibacter sp. PhB192]TCM28614.1 raffinose/stachyose/melibiose transport system permease protein [Rathayibacter sp. PhB179]
MTTTTTPLVPFEATAKQGKRNRPPRKMKSIYPSWFYIPAAALFIVFFAVPTFASLYFSLTRWTLFDIEFIGFGNFVQFFQEPQLVQGFINTFVYGFLTSAAKVVLGLALAVLLTSKLIGRGYLRAVVFFPVLVSTIGVGLTFKALLDPFDGLVNGALGVFGIEGPGWLTDPSLALLSVAAVDVWKGVGIATLIFIAGIVAIPGEYYEAAEMDGASSWKRFRNITLPLAAPATGTVIILSLIGGLRSFDLIWAMTKGGPGFTSDVIASVIYKQYQAGFYGLSTAGNVILFVVVTAIMIPISRLLNRSEANQ